MQPPCNSRSYMLAVRALRSYTGAVRRRKRFARRSGSPQNAHRPRRLLIHHSHADLPRRQVRRLLLSPSLRRSSWHLLSRMHSLLSQLVHCGHRTRRRQEQCRRRTVRSRHCPARHPGHRQSAVRSAATPAPLSFQTPPFPHAPTPCASVAVHFGSRGGYVFSTPLRRFAHIFAMAERCSCWRVLSTTCTFAS